MSNYAMAITVPTGYVVTLDRVRAALREQGFGVLTEIDVRATLKAKLGVDVPSQIILGACNPPLAHRALTAVPSVGVLLPCNVVVRTLDEEHTVVEALDPGAMVEVTGAASLVPIAQEARSRVGAALDQVRRAALASTPGD
jgi:uncharacterized protein (DUF302 family)